MPQYGFILKCIKNTINLPQNHIFIALENNVKIFLMHFKSFPLCIEEDGDIVYYFKIHYSYKRIIVSIITHACFAYIYLTQILWQIFFYEINYSWTFYVWLSMKNCWSKKEKKSLNLDNIHCVYMYVFFISLNIVNVLNEYSIIIPLVNFLDLMELYI